MGPLQSESTKAGARANFSFAVLVLIAILWAAARHYWRGELHCQKYSECNSALQPESTRPWDTPVDPVEKTAYDYAHALALPAGMPEPVAFDFRLARIKEGRGGKSVAQQYFEHLCKTEDVEVIARRVRGVEGFRVMRPRPNMEFTPLNGDRYRAEEPTGYGWSGEYDQFETRHGGGLEEFVQPLYGLYRYVEYQRPGGDRLFYRVERAAGDPYFDKGIDSGWRPSDNASIRVPFVMTHKRLSALASRYGYTWRGIRRFRDREFGIAGGEFLIVDLSDGTVLAARRTFNSTYVWGRPAFTNWYAARECRILGQSQNVRVFINRVLQPELSVNDEWVPRQYQAQYHQFIRWIERSSYADR